MTNPWNVTHLCLEWVLCHCHRGTRGLPLLGSQEDTQTECKMVCSRSMSAEKCAARFLCGCRHWSEEGAVFCPQRGGGRSSWSRQGVEVSLQEQRGCDPKGLVGVAFRLCFMGSIWFFFQQKNGIDFVYQGDRAVLYRRTERSRGHGCEGRQGRVSKWTARCWTFG